MSAATKEGGVSNQQHIEPPRGSKLFVKNVRSTSPAVYSTVPLSILQLLHPIASL